MPIQAWNDRVARALERRPFSSGEMLIESGQVSALTTVEIATSASVHHVFAETHSGGRDADVPERTHPPRPQRGPRRV